MGICQPLDALLLCLDMLGIRPEQGCRRQPRRRVKATGANNSISITRSSSGWLLLMTWADPEDWAFCNGGGFCLQG